MSRVCGRMSRLVLMLGVVAGVPGAYCDTLSSWNGGTGNWGTPSNWTPAAVPNNTAANGYSTTIASGGTDQVTIDAGLDPTLDSLTLGGSAGTSSLQFAASAAPQASLAVTGGVTINPTGSLDFGSFGGFGAGPFRGSLSVGGTLTNAGALSIYPGSLSAGNVVNSGSMVLLGEPGVGTSVSVPGTFNNSGTVRFGVLGIEGPLAPAAAIGQLVNTGTLSIDGMISGYVNASGVQNGGAISVPTPVITPPGMLPLGGLNVGTGTPADGYNQFSNGVLSELIRSPSSFGTIAVSGPVSLSGTLQITDENGFVPTAGESFVILTFTPGELTGSFDDVLGDPNAVVSYDDAAGYVSITEAAGTAVPEPGGLVGAGLGVVGICGVLRGRRRLPPS